MVSEQSLIVNKDDFTLKTMAQTNIYIHSPLLASADKGVAVI